MKKVFLFIFIFLFILFFYPSLILATDRVEINTASLQQLKTLTGIGIVKAQAIIDARPFSSVDNLLRVSGIGEKTLQKIKDQGLAYVSGGSPQDENIAVVQNTVPAETDPPEPADAPSDPTETAPYPSGIFINEILPNPEGPDETDEWIELYNSNSFEVDLSGWKIQDTTGTTKTHTIKKETPSTGSGQAKILSYGFLVFKRPETKIMLNNDEDGINLLTPDGKIIDSVSYIKAPLGQSYNKIIGSWAWSTVLTAGTKNIVVDTKTLSNKNISVKKEDTVAGLVNVGQNTLKNQEIFHSTKNPWFLFFTVLAITLLLAGAVLFIKFRVFRNKRETQH